MCVVNKAVSLQWHKEHCKEPNLHEIPQTQYEVCSTCGNTVQIPIVQKPVKKAV